MKKEKGYRITKIEVTIKHRDNESRRYLAMDLREAMRNRDEIKAVQAKVIRSNAVRSDKILPTGTKPSFYKGNDGWYYPQIIDEKGKPLWRDDSKPYETAEKAQSRAVRLHKEMKQ